MANDRTFATRAFHTRIAAAQDLLHQIAMQTPVGAAFADPVDVRVQLPLVTSTARFGSSLKVEKPPPGSANPAPMVALGVACGAAGAGKWVSFDHPDGRNSTHPIPQK
jgi:hypothetical protein